ncbi:hypothetical protein [Sedimentitalea sp.]|uniref:hypothetical protein n=1 Tax=Sedimentitalea sp. TaxID=2048915 RepID=UPI003296C1DE
MFGDGIDVLIALCICAVNRVFRRRDYDFNLRPKLVHQTVCNILLQYARGGVMSYFRRFVDAMPTHQMNSADLAEVSKLPKRTMPEKGKPLLSGLFLT